MQKLFVNTLVIWVRASPTTSYFLVLFFLRKKDALFAFFKICGYKHCQESPHRYNNECVLLISAVSVSKADQLILEHHCYPNTYAVVYSDSALHVLAINTHKSTNCQ